MSIFKMKADIEFEADSIDDAFDKLSEYFENIVDDEDNQFVIKGHVSIERKEWIIKTVV